VSFRFLSLLRCRQPSSCTLFPYTTLFRSKKGNVILLDTYYYSPKNRIHKKAPSDFSRDLWEFAQRVSQEYDRPIDRWTNSHKSRDRKSTRLNSSHVKSSYAVFCLKKKKPA